MSHPNPNVDLENLKTEDIVDKNYEVSIVDGRKLYKPIMPVINESLEGLCNYKKCNKPIDECDPNGEYCQEHYEYYYCECGRSLGEYEGEGFCKKCQ